METTIQERAKLTGTIQIPSALSEKIQQKVTNIQNAVKLFKEAQNQDISKLTEILFLSAVYLDASDIHLEPTEDQTKIRFRIDGILQDLLSIPSTLYTSLLSRIKLLSQIKLNISDRPQDGRFSLVLEGQTPIEIRAATLPSEYGESVVLRVLNPARALLSLEKLGLRKDLLLLVRKEIKKPNGIILVTGPTGSGKTTTLYAFLLEVQKPEIKIITIEDPIEYHLKGVSQTQVNEKKGYTFASGLRAIVRQDPDVILVGEIRDKDTADISLQAALTGHLVFSTLHTNDAPGTVARLLALGTKIETVASALNLVIAQRLVRKVCKECMSWRLATKEELSLIQESLASIQKELKPTIPKDLKIPKVKGCEICNTTGYKGRVGVFEAMLVDTKTEEFILTNPSTSALKSFAIKKGMVTMFQDGLLKVLEGITTLEELQRVTTEE